MLKLESFNGDSPQKVSAQRELFRECFPETSGTVLQSTDHYDWKFHGKAGEPSSFEFVARGDNVLLGYYAAIPYTYRFGSQLFRGGLVCDVMTSAKARGQGVFTRLGQFALDELRREGFDLTLGYPIRPEVMPGHLKVGWQIRFKLPIFVKIPWLGMLRAQLLLWQARRRGLVTEQMVPKVFLRSRDFADLRASLVQSELLHLERKADFMDWRLNMPAADYRVLVCRESGPSGRLLASAIIRTGYLKGIFSLIVVDVLMRPDAPKIAADALWAAVLSEACKERTWLIVTCLNPSLARRYRLGPNGWWRSPFSFKLITRMLSQAAAQGPLGLDEKHWHLSWIDSDVF